MSKKHSVTINWRGKLGQRGLTEVAAETLGKVGSKHKKPNLISDVENMLKDYFKLQSNKVFSYHDEVEMVKNYCNVRF
jgi:hypothetical protein